MPFKQNISKVNINITERRYHVVLSALLYDRKYNMSTYVSKPTFNIILDLWVFILEATWDCIKCLTIAPVIKGQFFVSDI